MALKQFLDPKFHKGFFLMQFFCIFSYTLVYLSYRKECRPWRPRIQFKIVSVNRKSRKCRNVNIVEKDYE